MSDRREEERERAKKEATKNNVIQNRRKRKKKKAIAQRALTHTGPDANEYWYAERANVAVAAAAIVAGAAASAHICVPFRLCFYKIIIIITTARREKYDLFFLRSRCCFLANVRATETDLCAGQRRGNEAKVFFRSFLPLLFFVFVCRASLCYYFCISRIPFRVFVESVRSFISFQFTIIFFCLLLLLLSRFFQFYSHSMR